MNFAHAQSTTTNVTVKMNKPKISVIGLGFVGLTLAVINARKGFDTIGIDIDKEKLEKLTSGQPDFFEPNLENS